MKIIKYIIIPIIGLGLTLSMVFTIKYNCQGKEMFPIFYGSPFVFKQKSLGSSMEYFYSISGLFLNITIWSIVITIIRFGFHRLLHLTSYKKTFYTFYKVSAVILLVFSILTIFGSLRGIGRGFDKNANYWYWDLNHEAKIWGMKCEGEFGFFEM